VLSFQHDNAITFLLQRSDWEIVEDVFSWGYVLCLMFCLLLLAVCSVVVYSAVVCVLLLFIVLLFPAGVGVSWCVVLGCDVIWFGLYFVFFVVLLCLVLHSLLLYVCADVREAEH